MKLRGEKKQDALLDGQCKLCSVAAAVIGSAVVGGVVASSSANKAVGAQRDAANQATATAQQSQRDSQAFQQAQLDQARIDNAPWRDAGAAALNKLSAAPDFAFNGSNLSSEPGYQFGLAEGMKGLTSSAAARGGLLSGAALKASTKYAQDYAGTKFNDSFSRALQTDTVNKNRLQSLAGIGQTAVGSLTSAGSQVGAQIGAGIRDTGQFIGGNQLGAGNARASGYLATGNALTNGLNQGISQWNQYNRLGQQPITEGATNQTSNFDYYGSGYSP